MAEKGTAQVLSPNLVAEEYNIESAKDLKQRRRMWQGEKLVVRD